MRLFSPNVCGISGYCPVLESTCKRSCSRITDSRDSCMTFWLFGLRIALYACSQPCAASTIAAYCPFSLPIKSSICGLTCVSQVRCIFLILSTFAVITVLLLHRGQTTPSLSRMVLSLDTSIPRRRFRKLSVGGEIWHRLVVHSAGLLRRWHDRLALAYPARGRRCSAPG